LFSVSCEASEGTPLDMFTLERLEKN